MIARLVGAALALAALVLGLVPAHAQTSRVRPDQLPTFAAPAYSNIAGTELLMAWQSGVLKQLTTGDFRSWVNGAGALTFSAGKVGVGKTPTFNLDVSSGNTSTPVAFNLTDSTHATSRRAAMNVGSNWTVMQDTAASGSKDFGIYNATTTTQAFTIAPATNVVNFTVAPTVGGSALGGSTLVGATNLVITNGGTPNTQVVVTANTAVASNGSAFAATTALSLTISTGSTGANALDAGTVANSTWYSVWAIYNGTTWSGLLSTSATAPTMPSGYTYKVRLGWVRTDGSAALYRTRQVGKRAAYVVTTSTNTAAMPLMASGAVGNISTPTWVAIAVGNYVPSTAVVINGTLAQGTNSTAMAAPNNAYGAATSTTNSPPAVASSSGNGSQQFSFVLESTNIYWAASSGYVYCAGWEDNL